MSGSDKVFAGSIPEFYDTYLVPLIFEPYASDLARRVAELTPSAVLETAAGTGVVTRALAPQLGADATYDVTDLNSPMLERASARQGLDKRLRWKQADALKLPFEDSSFDVVFCQFGVMFFPDRVAGYREAKRVIKPGGKFLFSAWDRIEENEFAQVVTEVAARIFPDDPPMFLARTPHGYADVGHIETDLRQAGFSDIQIETVEKRSDTPSARLPAVAYCQGTPLRNEIEARDAAALEPVTARAAQAIAERFGHGPVSGKISAHVVSATA